MHSEEVRSVPGNAHKAGIDADIWLEGFAPAFLLERIRQQFPVEAAALKKQDEMLEQ